MSRGPFMRRDSQVASIVCNVRWLRRTMGPCLTYLIAAMPGTGSGRRARRSGADLVVRDQARIEPSVVVHTHPGGSPMTHRRLMRSCAATLAMGLPAACGTVTPAPATGTPPARAPSAAPTRTAAPVDPPVTLRLADAEDQGRSSQPWIDRFIEELDDRSDGIITIQPLDKAGGGNVEQPRRVDRRRQVMAARLSSRSCRCAPGAM